MERFNSFYTGKPSSFRLRNSIYPPFRRLYPLTKVYGTGSTVYGIRN